MCLFEHDLFHSGAPLGMGTKYIMRTDVVFDQGNYDESEHLLTGQMQSKNKNILVADVCNELAMNEQNKEILKKLDLYSVSCKSMLSPGITLLRNMLMECGMDDDTVQNLTRRVLEVAKA